MVTKRFLETIEDLEKWCEDMNCTLQITYRTRSVPRWLVRIKREGTHRLIYRQAVDDDLSEAFEMCVEAWLKDEEAKSAGRRSTTDTDD